MGSVPLADYFFAVYHRSAVLASDQAALAPQRHTSLELIDGEFVLQYEPGIDVSLAGQQFRLRAFEDRDMYFGALDIAGCDANGKFHALADSRRHGAQFVPPR